MKSGGGYQLEFEDLIDSQEFPYHNVPILGLEIDGKRALIDVEDGYWYPVETMKFYLDWCDFYFKRSFSEERNLCFTVNQRNKMIPFGFNYAVYYHRNPYNDTQPVDIKEMLRRFLGKKPNSYFSPEKFEEIPQLKNAQPKILFSSRLWDPYEVKLKELQEEREYINQMRIRLTRSLKKEYGSLFTGGLHSSPYSQKYARDLILPYSMTERSRYLNILHQQDICIGTMGLHESIGWKTAEYIAAGKAIVNEELRYGVPGNFEKNKNYLAFKNDVDCMDQVARLVENSDFLYEMKMNNYWYYKKFLKPDSLMERVIKCIIDT